MNSPLPPAGWHSNPSGEGLRWWDGEKWTEITTPNVEQSSGSPSFGAPEPLTLEPKANREKKRPSLKKVAAYTLASFVALSVLVGLFGDAEVDDQVVSESRANNDESAPISNVCADATTAIDAVVPDLGEMLSTAKTFPTNFSEIATNLGNANFQGVEAAVVERNKKVAEFNSLAGPLTGKLEDVNGKVSACLSNEDAATECQEALTSYSVYAEAIQILLAGALDYVKLGDTLIQAVADNDADSVRGAVGDGEAISSKITSASKTGVSAIERYQETRASCL